MHLLLTSLDPIDIVLAVANVAATFLVAKKVGSGWAYFCVMDQAYVWLFLKNELFFTAALYFAYSVIAGWGYKEWRKLSVQK